MSPRSALAAVAASLVLLVGAACGATGGGPTGPAAAPPPRVGAIKIDPSSGPIGTMFTLTATGLKEGEAVAFEITFPGEGKAYPGAAISVPADGTATTTYRATTANQPGDYAVRLTGPPGSLAEGRFTVTDGPPITTAIAGKDDTDSTSSATSGRSGTTGRLGRTTTTVKAGATTSTPKASTTTPTTRRPNTTTPPTRSPTTTR